MTSKHEVVYSIEHLGKSVLISNKSVKKGVLSYEAETNNQGHEVTA